MSTSSTNMRPAGASNIEDAKAAKAAKALRARTMGRITTDKQNSARAALPIGGLYIVLFLRDGENPVTNDFHWGYYLHTSAEGGMKYHVRGRTNMWNPGHEATGGPFKSILLCVLIQIGQIPVDKFDKVDQIMRTHDSVLNSFSGFSCRVWIWMIMEKLIEGEVVELSGTVDQLEQECFAFGNQYISTTVANEQPRPVVRSGIAR